MKNITDFFGTSTLIKGAVNVALLSARGSGRTQSLIDNLKNGDCVVTLKHIEGKRISRLCAERGIKVKYITVKPSESGRVFEHARNGSRIMFDHSWIEEFYLNAIKNAQETITFLEKECNRSDENYVETEIKRNIGMKWKN